MPEPSTFIKLDRNILKWGWYKNANTFRLFVHLLLTANVKNGKFETIVVKRGQIATSQSKLAEQLGLSVKAVRIALEHLKRTGEVAVKTTSKYSIITIKKYNEYQNTAGKKAVKGLSEGSLTAGEGQQLKNIKNKRREEGKPTLSEIQKFVVDNSLNVNAERFFEYYSAKGWKINGKPIDEWQQLVRTWEQKEYKPYASGAYAGVKTLSKADIERLREEEKKYEQQP